MLKIDSLQINMQVLLIDSVQLNMQVVVYDCVTNALSEKLIVPFQTEKLFTIYFTGGDKAIQPPIKKLKKT